MRNRKPHKTVLVTNIPAYVNWWNWINRFTFIVTAEGNYYVVDGIRVKASELEKAMPELVANSYPKGKNLDGRTNFY